MLGIILTAWQFLLLIWFQVWSISGSGGDHHLAAWFGLDWQYLFCSCWFFDYHMGLIKVTASFTFRFTFIRQWLHIQIHFGSKRQWISDSITDSKKIGDQNFGGQKKLGSKNVGSKKLGSKKVGVKNLWGKQRFVRVNKGLRSNKFRDKKVRGCM